MSSVSYSTGGSAPAAVAPKGKMSGGRIIAILAAVGAFILLSVAILGFIGFRAVNNQIAAPKAVAEPFIASIQAGDSTTAYTKTSPMFQQETSAAAFDRYVKTLGPLLATNKSLGERTIRTNGGNKSATLVYDVGVKSGGTVQETLQLSERDGKWLVDGISGKGVPR